MGEDVGRRRLLLALLWIAAVHASGLYLFTTGFFLTRFEVPDVSTCHEPPDVSLIAHRSPGHLRGHDAFTTAGSTLRGCWMPRRFRRVVLVVIDALRFDFVASGVAAPNASPSFYLHHLPILNETLRTSPEHALLLKFVADPPTMTMQRLKGLTTGSLPTFLDIKDNMASSEITEDNIIQQVHAARRPMVFMGDDTWDSLYPTQFTRKYSYDSFNVKDLHTVDRGVIDHLFPELHNDDWDLLIAHMLGVDHVGHTHGPSSPHMTEKLDEMNRVLTKLLSELPDGDETLLLVMGDHGMSADGNHGGASDEETGAALFAYSKTPIVHKDHNNRWGLEVPQVDLVPTISLLLGLPIPFGNLGSIIPHFFMDTATLIEALRLNVAQVRRYLFTYSSASKLPQSDFDHLERMHEEIVQLLEQHEHSLVDTELVAKQQEYLREALALGRSIWTQFDLCSMAWGILLLVLGQVITCMCLFQSEAVTTSPMLLWPLVGAAVGALLPLPVNWLPRQALARSLLFAAMCGSVCPVGTKLCSGIHCGWSTLTRGVLRLDFAVAVAFSVVLLHALALLSNSYIVAEDKVMNFLVATVGVFFVWKSRRVHTGRQRHATAAAFAFLAASRLVSVIDPPNIILSTTSVSRTWLPLAIILVSTGVISGSPLGLPRSWVVIYAVVACGAYWLLEPTASPLLRLWLPRSVFLLTLGGISLRTVRYRNLYPDPPTLSTLLALAFALVLGPSSPVTVLCIAVQHASFAVVMQSMHSTQPTSGTASWILMWCTVCYQSFFVTGHQNTFTSLQNAAGFVGFDEFHFYWAGALLGLNTFGCHALGMVGALPFLARQRDALRIALLTFVAYFALNALISTVFVALQRRHLMVWAIFAPKFIFDGATLLVIELMATVTILTIVPSSPNPLK